MKQRSLEQTHTEWIEFILADLGLSHRPLPIKFKWSSTIKDAGYFHIYATPDKKAWRLFTVTVLRTYPHPKRALAHELCHYHQIVSGQLDYVGKYTILWQGTEYDRRTYDYYTSPWEVAARAYHTRMEAYI